MSLALEKLRMIYADIHDTRSGEVEIDSLTMQDLLRFCLQRPTNCSLIGRTGNLSDISHLVAKLSISTTLSSDGITFWQ